MRRANRGLLTAVFAIMAAFGVLASDDRSEQPPSQLRNTLSWATDSEVDVFGFYVYRATEHEQAFSRLNENPLPARGGPDIGARYQYEDVTIQPGLRYRYYINQLDNSGREERLTPVLASRPKYPGP